MNPREDEDSDFDSLYEESPTDGYFSPRDIPTERYAQDRSSSTPHVKAREAEEERQTSSRPRTESAQYRRVSEPSAWPDERTPLLDEGPPPPAYSDVTAGRPYTGSEASSQHSGVQDGYGATTQSREQNTWGPSTSSVAPTLFGRLNGPEDLGGASGAEGNESEQAPQSRGKRRRSRIRRCFTVKRIIHVVLVIWGIVALTTLSIRVSKGKANSGKDTDHDHGDHEDHKIPAAPIHTSVPKIPDVPEVSGCPFSEYSETYGYDFDSPDSFSFIELIEESNHISGGINGSVKVARAPAEQKASIRAEIMFATTAPWAVSGLEAVKDSNSLYLKNPYFVKRPRRFSGKPCMEIHVQILVKDHVTLDNFELATENLEVRVESGLFMTREGEPFDGALHISNKTEITVIHGSVSMAYWNSRETRIDVVSGSVSGRYALRDLLSIRTRSGSVTIDVDPKPADPTSPAPADFTALSTSGSVRIRFPTSGTAQEIPEREYRTRVETESGSVSGEYILGLMATFRTNAGSITSTILPYAADMFASSLRTETRNGATDIRLLSPFKDRGSVMGRLHSLHTSVSSSLKIAYPQEWEGLIDGETTSGSINLRGKDVERLKHYEGPMSQHVLAKKGRGGSRLDFSTASGSVDCVVGDLY